MILVSTYSVCPCVTCQRELQLVCFAIAGELRPTEQAGDPEEGQEESLERITPGTDFCADR
jgi:hypothetical protein